MANLYEEERRLIKQYEEARRAYVGAPPKDENEAAEQRLQNAKTELHRFWETHSTTEEAGR